MNDEKKVRAIVGNKLKNLRISGGYSSYEVFAVENEISRMQYWRVEQGKANLTLKSLVRILNIHKITVADFFYDSILQPVDKKLHNKE